MRRPCITVADTGVLKEGALKWRKLPFFEYERKGGKRRRKFRRYKNHAPPPFLPPLIESQVFGWVKHATLQEGCTW